MTGPQNFHTKNKHRENLRQYDWMSGESLTFFKGLALPETNSEHT